ncbi:M48 family metalloprotease [uncultured Neptuniibacter sp.]|uniref:M48 family metalloprotease n=1 Tax=uncultured Neptuniibacter sp. TaxID=502143 RepID=UPI00262D7D25|nr:M48 family metalloprotease [uncultured Neptuniibacter sp.]
MYKPVISCFIACLLTLYSLSSKSESQLPSIGGSGYSVLSLQKEYQLGRAWVRMLRGSARIYEDAFVSQYIEDLTWSLVTHSQLTDRRLEILVLDNPSVNAFAVPGGVIGVHTGLLLTAKNEAQLASVLAHELAHLSQRHFAAQLEEQQRNRPFHLATILGSILLAAADPEAGIVGLQSSMAASAANKLAFSRQNEREADYIGMQTLTSSGYPPIAMANMFTELQKQARFSRVPPEFLLTHPVTQSRISDALNRAESIQGKTPRLNSIEFNLVKARIQANYSKDLPQLLKKYQETQKLGDNDSIRYAIAITAIKAKSYALAAQNINSFSPAFRSSLPGRLLQAELELAKEKYKKAVTQLEKLVRLYPGSHAVSYLYADALLRNNQPRQASRVYRQLIEHNPNDSRAWYLLAESYGLEGNIVGVHEARIEYFLLTANIDKALRQLDFALREKTLTSSEKARLEQRKEDALQIRESLKLDY